MPNILIRDVSEEVLYKLKQKAADNGRSLQQELKLSIEMIAEQGATYNPAEAAERIRQRLARRGRSFTDSTQMIREDRDR